MKIFSFSKLNCFRLNSKIFFCNKTGFVLIILLSIERHHLFAQFSVNLFNPVINYICILSKSIFFYHVFYTSQFHVYIRTSKFGWCHSFFFFFLPLSIWASNNLFSCISTELLFSLIRCDSCSVIEYILIKIKTSIKEFRKIGEFRLART